MMYSISLVAVHWAEVDESDSFLPGSVQTQVFFFFFCPYVQISLHVLSCPKDTTESGEKLFQCDINSLLDGFLSLRQVFPLEYIFSSLDLDVFNERDQEKLKGCISLAGIQPAIKT